MAARTYNTQLIVAQDWDDAVQSDRLPLSVTSGTRIVTDRTNNRVDIYVGDVLVFRITSTEVLTILPITQVESI